VERDRDTTASLWKNPASYILMLVLLTGGTGGAKLVQGVCHEVDPGAVTIICNTADDFSLHGLHISPDLDTILYTLAGLSDAAKGWGIQDDTFTVLAQLEKLGGEAWFKLGDKDIATHITRTRLLREGLTLAAVTDRLRKTLGVRATILPMSSDTIETRVETSEGEISFQEYFVKQRWEPEVRNIFYSGVEHSRPAAGLLQAIGEASGILICPSNPVTSIGPILAVPGIMDTLKKVTAPVVAISPILGELAISGPAHKLMAAGGMEPSAFGVAKAYADFLDIIIVDRQDEKVSGKIAKLGIEVVPSSIIMNSLADKRRLARQALALIEK
jgi:LPPG:FO 2-phospho-L-lactate transferase